MTEYEPLLESRIEKLEMQLSFQDDTIETLNQALAAQQAQLLTMQEQLKLLAEKVKSSQTQSAVVSMAEETPPPHY
ncbi:SlyX family protein [Catenovulum sp. SM1970]|uniref:SlyX family protein n=1 Tax=Marinifaba aquimaris TaxID=2741323 RepID=UPI001574442B|nr:SlyX family protein [Marinifaba aquimaris]NTS75683.1 SlyX family protein [Marinifaba aquimaris]